MELAPTLLHNDLIITSYICNDPICNEGHIQRHWGYNLNIYIFGYTIQLITLRRIKESPGLLSP